MAQCVIGFARFLYLTSQKICDETPMHSNKIGFNFFSGLAVISTSAVEKPGDDPLDWLRDSIPGEPGVDYPIFSAVEQTAFSCDGKVFGGKNFFLYFLLLLYSKVKGQHGMVDGS